MRACELPGTRDWEMHYMGGECGECQADGWAWEEALRWSSLTPAERIASRWYAARYLIAERIELSRFDVAPF